MKKTHSLKVRHYAARLIDLDEYLVSFPGTTIYDKIGVTELNEIILNSMPNSWYKKSYVQGFDCTSILFKKALNMFGRMDIAKSIYEGVLTPSYKKPLGQMKKVLDSLVTIEENLNCIILTP